jgi:C_GCAxxG_C_C family probable redox protein
VESDKIPANGKRELAQLIGKRAGNLFDTGQLLCSEALLVVMNRVLGGGMSDELATRVASTLPQGIGESGCTCGALAAGALALGLFLGRSRPGESDKLHARQAANLLYSRFKERYGSSCCRVLTGKVKEKSGLHAIQCSTLTAETAEMVARLLLDRRPQLVEQVDWEYLKRTDSRVGTKLRQLFGLAKG